MSEVPARPADTAPESEALRSSQRSSTSRLIGALALLAVGSLIALAVVLVGGEDASAPVDPGAFTTTNPSDEPAGEVLLDGSTVGTGEVLLEPVRVPTVDAFTESVGLRLEQAPAIELPALPMPTTVAPLTDQQVPLAQIAGNEPGLYGGTRDTVDCDATQLIDFLETETDKGSAWAKVQGVDSSDLPDYIKGLTPVTLTRDTRVTNHGFKDGKAESHQSVLQAGHSVFVDEFGVPRAKCSCGNPLVAPEPLSTAPVYVGDPWPDFDPVGIIVIIPTSPVDGGFVIVDLDIGEFIDVPVGGFPLPEEEAPGAEAPGGVDEDLAVELVNIGNILAVTPGATIGATFTVEAPTLITSVRNYHYGPETPPGQVGLTSSDGSFFGPWQTVGTEGQGGVANAYWTATPFVVIPAGTYTVWDSEPSTWSTNADAGGVGFTVVHGVVGVLDSSATGGPPPPSATDLPGEPEWSPEDTAGEILDQLLLDCGVEYGAFTSSGGDVNGWRWMVDTPTGTADFYIGFIEGDPGWYVDARNDVAVSLATSCGFLEVG